MEVQKATFEKLVQKMCTEENVTNPIVKYLTNGPQNGFASSITKIEITGDNKTLHLIAKYASTDETFRNNMDVRKYFLQEIKFYMEVMPLYNKLKETVGATNFFINTPKCYGFEEAPMRELVVLEDLTNEGYVMKDSLMTMDDTHVEFVLNEYGKLHALALAYKHYDFEGYQNLIRNTENIHKVVFGCKSAEVFSQVLCDLKNALDPKERMFEAYSKLCEDFREIEDRSTETDEYSVLYHGDSWCNNFLFKYESDENRLTDIKLIDFQIMGPGSVALDISYFLMANCSPEMIKNTDHYLKVYYDYLALHLRELKCNPEVVFSQSTFEDQWKKYSVHGLILAIVALKFAMTEPDEKPDLTKDFVNSANFVGKHDVEYKKRTGAIVRYYYEAGII